MRQSSSILLNEALTGQVVQFDELPSRSFGMFAAFPVVPDGCYRVPVEPDLDISQLEI